MGCTIISGNSRMDEYDVMPIIDSSIRNMKEQVARIPDKPAYFIPSPNTFLNVNTDFAAAKEAYIAAFTNATSPSGFQLLFSSNSHLFGDIITSEGEKIGHFGPDTILFIDTEGTIFPVDLDIASYCLTMVQR